MPNGTSRWYVPTTLQKEPMEINHFLIMIYLLKRKDNERNIIAVSVETILEARLLWDADEQVLVFFYLADNVTGCR